MVNVNTVSIVDFNKYISRTDLSNEDFKKVLEDLNARYIELSKEVMEINEKRTDVLDRIRISQLAYKKQLGHNEINLKDDDEEDEDNLIKEEEKIVIEDNNK
jgi:hypothetical protein